MMKHKLPGTRNEGWWFDKTLNTWGLNLSKNTPWEPDDCDNDIVMALCYLQIVLALMSVIANTNL